MPHRGLEPASAACRSGGLPTEPGRIISQSLACFAYCQKFYLRMSPSLFIQKLHISQSSFSPSLTFPTHLLTQIDLCHNRNKIFTCEFCAFFLALKSPSWLTGRQVSRNFSMMWAPGVKELFHDVFFVAGWAQGVKYIFP